MRTSNVIRSVLVSKTRKIVFGSYGKTSSSPNCIGCSLRNCKAAMRYSRFQVVNAGRKNSFRNFRPSPSFKSRRRIVCLWGKCSSTDPQNWRYHKNANCHRTIHSMMVTAGCKVLGALFRPNDYWKILYSPWGVKTLIFPCCSPQSGLCSTSCKCLVSIVCPLGVASLDFHTLLVSSSWLLPSQHWEFVPLGQRKGCKKAGISFQWECTWQLPMGFCTLILQGLRRFQTFERHWRLWILPSMRMSWLGLVHDIRDGCIVVARVGSSSCEVSIFVCRFPNGMESCEAIFTALMGILQSGLLMVDGRFWSSIVYGVGFVRLIVCPVPNIWQGIWLLRIVGVLHCGVW